jgi:hypothetical protein
VNEDWLQAGFAGGGEIAHHGITVGECRTA